MIYWYYWCHILKTYTLCYIEVESLRPIVYLKAEKSTQTTRHVCIIYNSTCTNIKIWNFDKCIYFFSAIIERNTDKYILKMQTPLMQQIKWVLEKLHDADLHQMDIDVIPQKIVYMINRTMHHAVIGYLEKTEFEGKSFIRYVGAVIVW